MNGAKKQVEEFFDEDSSDYLKHQYSPGSISYMALRRQHAARLIERYLAPQFTTQARFLDAGCGPGILVEILGRYPIEYHGLDISEEMLRLAEREVARHACPGFRAEFRKGDVENLPYPDASFDAAASLGVIEYLPGDTRFVSELARVTRPGGHVLVAITNARSYNLSMEGVIRWIRNSRVVFHIAGRIKSWLGRGEFKRMQFTMRRHDVPAFLRSVREAGLEIVDTATWGFNLLPYPLNMLCGYRLNRLANRWFDASRRGFIRARGEGVLVLCRRPPPA